MKRLVEQQCQHILEGTPAMADEQVRQHLSTLPGWTVENGRLCKVFSFKNYHETMAFLNATAWVSHRQDHHPDIDVGYNNLTIRYNTHTVNGLSLNDFICAARVEALFT